MDDHHCIQEHKLGEMESKIDRMDKELFNGEGGIVKVMPVLSNNVKKLDDSVLKLSDSIEDLRTIISAFSKFESEEIGGRKKVDDIRKNRLTTLQMMGIVIGALVGIFSILGFFRSMRNDKSINQVNENIDKLDMKMYFKQDKTPDSTVRGLHGGVTLDTTKLFIDIQ